MSFRTETERHQLAERAVGDGADDNLGAAGQHLLHLHTLDLRIRLILLGVGKNGVVGLLGLGAAQGVDGSVTPGGTVAESIDDAELNLGPGDGLAGLILHGARDRRRLRQDEGPPARVHRVETHRRRVARLRGDDANP